MKEVLSDCYEIKIWSDRVNRDVRKDSDKRLHTMCAKKFIFAT